MRLAMWRPVVEAPQIYKVFDLSPEQRARAQANTCTLVYWGSFHAESPYVDPFENENAGRPGPLVQVYVDAMTGRVLAIEGGDYGIGGDSRPRPKAPFGWDIGPADMTVQAGSKSVAVKDARVDLCPPKGDPKQGVELFLSFAHVTLRCRFDPKTGLLSTIRDGQVSFGKPNEALLAAIQSALQSK
jgi:hypothetical protein